MKRKPTGFIAVCQCDVVTGAMDFTRTQKNDAGKILGQWLSDGCTVTPRFVGTWEESIKPCQCDAKQQEPHP